MNSIYKLKFNRRTLSLDAVSELATNAITASTNHKDSRQPALSLQRLCTLINTFALPASALLLTANSLAVEPRSGMNVVNGYVNVVTNGAVTSIANSPNAIINWQKFNIQSDEIVKFLQQSSDSAVLNRVLGGELTQILGTLQSNGKVFIVNPAGIVFGEHAKVDVASLVASTLDLSDADFLKGNYVFNQEKDKAITSVINQGMIKVAEDGTLALVGGKVLNTGILEAKNGTIYLLAGQSITIQDLDNSLISYKVTADNKAVNLGEIVAKRAVLLANKISHGYNQDPVSFVDIISGTSSAQQASITASGEVVLYGASEAEVMQDISLNNSQLTNNYACQSAMVVVNGTINVSNSTGVGGNVTVLGDLVVLENNALIDASGNQGGTVYLGGDQEGTGDKKLAKMLGMDTQAVVNVSGTGGDAGTTIAWGNTAFYDGTFLATSVYGNGGFVETSANYINLLDNINVKTDSTYGTVGNWLIDPAHAIIVDNETMKAEAITFYKLTASSDLTPTSNIYIGWYYPEKPTTANFIYSDKLSEVLNNSSVSIRTNLSITFYKVQNFTPSNSSNALDFKTGNYTFWHSNFTSDVRFRLVRLSSDQSGLYFNLTNSNIQIRSLNANIGAQLAMNNSSITTTQFLIVNTSWRATINNSTLNSGGALNITVCATRSTDHALRFVGNSSITAKGDIYLISPRGVLINGANTSITGGGTINIFGSYQEGDNTPINLTNVNIQGRTASAALNIAAFSSNNYTAVTLNNVSFKNLSEVSLTAYQFNATNTSTENVTGDIVLNIISGNLATINRTTLNSTTGNISITKSDGSLTVNNSNFTADQNLSVAVANGTFTVTGSNLSANKKLDLNVTIGSFIGNRANLSAKEDLVVISNSALNFSRSLLSGESISLLGSSRTNINLDNSTFKGISNASSTLNISNADGKGAIYPFITLDNLTLQDFKDIDATGLRFNASNVTTRNIKGNITFNIVGYVFSNVNYSNFTAGGNVTFSKVSSNLSFDSTNVTAAENLVISSGGTGNLQFNNSNLVSNTGFISLSAASTVDFTTSTLNSATTAVLLGTTVNTHSSNLTTKSDLEVGNNSSQNINLSNSSFKSTTGNVSVSGTTEILVTNSSLNATVDLNLTTAARPYTLTNGQIKINNSNGGKLVAGRDLNITTNNLELNSTILQATGNIGLAEQTAQAGSFTANNASLNATNVSVSFNTTNLNASKLYARKNLDLVANATTISNSSNLSAANNLTLQVTTASIESNSQLNATNTSIVATNGTAVRNGAIVNSSQGTIISSREIIVDNATVKSAANTTLNATDIDIVNGANVCATRNTFINATRFVNVTNGAKVSGNHVNLSAATNSVKIEDSNITAIAQTEVYAKQHINVTNSSINSTTSTTTLYGEASINLNSANLSAFTDLNLTTPALVANRTNFSAQNITLKGQVADVSSGTGTSGEAGASAQSSILLHNSSLTASENVLVQADEVNARLTKVKGQEINISATNVNLQDSLLNATTKDLIAKAINNLSITASEVKASKTNVTLSGNNVTLTQANVTAIQLLQVNATAGTANISKTNLTVTSGNLTLVAKEGIQTAGSNLTASNNADLVSSNSSITISSSNLTAQSGSLNLTARSAINITNFANVSAKMFTNFTATEISNIHANVAGTNVYYKGKVNTLHSTINASAALSLESGDALIYVRNTNLSAGTNFTAKGNRTSFITGNLTVKDNANVTSTDFVNFNGFKVKVGSLNATAATLLNFRNSQVTSNKTVTLTAGSGSNHYLQVNNTSITANGSVNVTANAIRVNQNSNITSKEANVTVNASTLACFTNANLSGQALIVRGQTLNLSNSSFNATTSEISLGNADTTYVNVKDSKLVAGNATAGDVNLRGNNYVNFSNSTISAGRDVNLASPTGIVNISNASTIEAGRSINITSAQVELNATLNATQSVGINASANVNGTNTNISAGTVAVKARSINFTNSALNATQGDLALNASANLELNSTIIRAAVANVSLVGANVSANNSAVVAAKNLAVNATSGYVNATNTTLSANAGNLTVEAYQGFTAQASNLSGQEAVTLSVANGALTLTDTNVTSTANSASLTAKGNTNLENANISAANYLSVNSTEGDIVANASNLSSAKGTNLTAHAEVNLTNSSVSTSAGSTLLVGTNKIEVNNSNISSTANTNLTSASIITKNTNVSGAEVSFAGKIDNHNSTIVATGNVTLNVTGQAFYSRGTNVTAGADITTKGASISILNGTFTSTGNTTLTSSGLVNINRQSAVQAKNINATAGSVMQISDSSLNSTEQTVLTAKTGLRLNNVDVNASTGATLTAAVVSQIEVILTLSQVMLLLTQLRQQV